MNLDKDTIYKTLTLYGSSFIGIGLGFAISIFNTKILGKESFGDYKFIETVFRLLAGLVSIGFFVSITRMLALAKQKKYRDNLIGFFVIVLLVTGLAGVIILLIISYSEPFWFSKELIPVFKKYAFLFFAILSTNNLKEILKGLNKIYTLSLFNALPAILYLVLAYTYNLNNPLYLEDILLFYYGLQLVVTILIILKMKPSFNIGRNLIQDVLKENKTNGKPIYFGSLAGVATGQIVGLTISYYLNNTQVGFYALAMTICSPLLLVPSVLGTSFFKKFTSISFIPKQVVLFSILVTVIAIIVFYGLIDKVFLLFYEEEFIPVIAISKLLIFGFAIHGLGDLINRFLGAKGLGKLLRNAAFAVGAVNILGYSVFVKFFGINGAIITSITASTVYLGMMLYYYKNFRKNNIYV